MNKSWTGTLITALIVAGVAAVLLLNLQPARPTAPPQGKPTISPDIAGDVPGGMGVIEHPIGDEVTMNHMRIAAVWLSAVTMEGMPSTVPSGQAPIHIEADVKATEGNEQGFSKDHFIPYLEIRYSVVAKDGTTVLDSGRLGPMMAKDGFHYGATIAMPKPGDYSLVYDIQPGSVNNLGLHRDAATGVKPWWKPFTAKFEWTVDPTPPKAPALAGNR